ncbi:MAG: hypothetical protein ACXVAY_08110 [Mucilaginibacter sp.]
MFNWLSEIFKLSKEDKVVKIVIRIVAVCFGAFIIFCMLLLAKSLYRGKTAKIADREFNFPTDDENKKDSSKKALLGSSSNPKDSTKKGSNEIKSRHLTNVKTPIKYLTQNKKTDTIKPIDTNNRKAQMTVQFHAPVIGSPMQFGSGSTQYNQFNGKIDRHPDDNLLNALINYLPVKNKLLTIAYETPDIESKNFSFELKSILERNGYTNITLFGHLEIGTAQQAKPIMVDTANYRVSVELNGH